MWKRPAHDPSIARRIETLTPLVSIVIPFYRQEAYLAAAVDSARAQTHPRIEILVVDDGSPVEAARVLEGADDGITILRSGGRGTHAAMNHGLRQSTGEYLLFLGADELLAPRAVEAHLRAQTAKPAAGMSFGAGRLIDNCGEPIRPARILRTRASCLPMLLEGNPVPCPGAAMMRRETLLEAGGYNESLRLAAEYDLYLRIALRHPVAQVPQRVVDYRRQDPNLPLEGEKILLATMRALDRAEADPGLSPGDRSRLLRGRRRWTHSLRPRSTVGHHAAGLGYQLRDLFEVSPRSYLGGRRA